MMDDSRELTIWECLIGLMLMLSPLIFLGYILLTPHIPKFHSGDCINSKKEEFLINPLTYGKVLKVGKKHYLLDLPDEFYPETKRFKIESNIEQIDAKNHKVECPKELNERHFQM